MKLERLGEQKKSRYNKKRGQHLDHYLPFKLNVDKDLYRVVSHRKDTYDHRETKLKYNNKKLLVHAHE